MSRQLKRRTNRSRLSKCRQNRRLKIESLENRRLLAVDFANASPVGDLDYVSMPNASFPAGYEQTVRMETSQAGQLTLWSENLGQGELNLFVYDSNRNLLQSSTSGTRRIDLAVGANESYFVYYTAPQAISNTNLFVSNLISGAGNATAVSAPTLGSGIAERTSWGTSTGSDATVGIDGFSVSRVNYASGAFIQQTDGTWILGSTTFTESGRDKWSVYLASGNLNVQLDLFDGVVRAELNGATSTDPITKAFEATGRTANAVSYENSVGTTGYFYKSGPNTWTERFDTSSANAPQSFTYTETSRDDWSVYLSGSVGTFQLDLNEKTVKRSGGVFYTIEEASQAPGWLDGMGGNHAYSVDASAASAHAVGINGLNYGIGIGTGVSISIDAGAGTDKLTAIGSSGTDNVAAQGATHQMTGSSPSTSYQITTLNVEDTTTSATDGTDTMTFFDRANAADHFFSDLNSASVTSAILYGLDGSYRNAAIGFNSVVAQRSSSPTANDAGDVAIMRDGPASGDRINIVPGTATMTYANGLGTSAATGYNIVHTYSDDGNDVANMGDTTNNDTFYADRRVNHQNSSGASRTGFAFLNDGGSTLFFAGGYHSTNANATAGGTDTGILYTAYLSGAGADAFSATPAGIRIQGAGNSFDNSATGFEQNYGYSDLRGVNDDTATFADSSGNDTFVVGTANAWMQYPGVTTYVTAFANTTINKSAGGSDTASLFDSSGSDQLTTPSANQVNFTQTPVSGTGPWVYQVNNFDTVFATRTASSTGTDTAPIAPLGNVTFVGPGWNRV